MAEMHRLEPDQLKLDQPLPWDVYDGSGHLLLRKGFVIQSDDQIATLIERGMYVNAAEYRKHEAENTPARYDAMSLWESVQAHLAFIAEAMPQDGSMQPEITRLARQAMLISERSPDLALAAIMLLDQRNYPVAHSLHTALIADMVARSANWSAAERTSLVCAALTMNIAMLELQLRLCNQQEKLSPQQRTAINNHPAESARQLIVCGVEDDEWLRAVLEHHETPEGLGYPRKVRTPSDLAMLVHTADVFCAKVSPRSHRKPMIASEATKSVFTKLAHGGKNPFPAMLVKEIGIYPPGTIVRLVSGETGVVLKRGPNAKSPVIATLMNASGMPSLKPVIRHTATDPSAAVGMALSLDRIMIGVNFHQLWGAAEH
ncbi:HD-GYP domain-containing protein [Uliginosibacterium aquaticum]|uniref:Phosphohydrolase n=1 Tax=Uliginosibacterium aquaticum TaxID=2731212 RepID=A0ABX2ID51_9RHOO|nr:HD domain-containing phosphohydrolase [Uliginosibacterium aquaticum]NSL54449.1 hypothetical protein [Uliginosibacterium aquaticum]